MDANDLYYSEGSPLIDNTNTNWIENTVLVGNENISWQEDGPEITVDYSEIAIDQSLAENEDYLTADTGDSDETSQYFSILESNCDTSEILNNNSNFASPNINNDCVVNVEVVKEETIIPDITKLETVDNGVFNKNSDNQLVIYRMDGSDDLFAVQIADDGKGNLQKYQYKVTQSATGEFEAIPGSVEIRNTLAEEMPSSNETTSHKTNFSSHFIKEEPRPTDNSENILTHDTADNHFDSSEIENNFFIHNSDKNFDNINPEYVLQHAYNQSEEYETDSIDRVLEDTGSSKETKDIVARSFVNATNIFPPGDDSESEYEIEALDDDFQDDGEFDENHYEEQTDNCDLSPVLQHKADSMNLLDCDADTVQDGKQHLPSNHNVTIFKDEKHLSILVVKGKEKENVSYIRGSNSFSQSNLRSILKSNCSITNVNPTHNIVNTNHHHQQQQQQYQAAISSPPVSEPSEEVVQVITTAIKSVRQPRKQTITPVERVGSEIIVQPLVYSLDVNTSSGLVTATSTVKRKRVPDEILQISDESDPEFTLKPYKKKKSKRGKYLRRKQKKAIEITIIETDDEMLSEDSVIEVLTDNDSSTNDEVEEILDQDVSDKSDSKVREKEMEVTAISDNESTTENNVVDDTSTAADKCENGKKLDTTATSEKIESEKKNESGMLRKNKCPICPKTFPRQITLRKHLLIHSTRRNLRSRTNVKNRMNDTSAVERSGARAVNKVKPERVVNEKKEYRCAKCKLNFLTDIQYKRHQTVHTMNRSSNGTAALPLKKPVASSEHSLKPTFHSLKHLRSATKIRNDALLLRTSKVIKPKAVKETLKCEYCGQMFAERAVFTLHRNSHKTFPCPNCKTTFTAKLLLDDHLRKNCLKSPVRKRITTRSLMKCDVCYLAFATTQQLQNHTTFAHKTKRSHLKQEPKKPNKHLVVKKRGAHDGVPMSVKMQKAFDKVKLKT